MFETALLRSAKERPRGEIFQNIRSLDRIFVGDVGLVEAERCREAKRSRCENLTVAGDNVETLSMRIDGVGKVTSAVGIDALTLQKRRDAAAGEVFGENDPVGDVDLIGIGSQRKVVLRDGDAPAEIDRLFGVKIFSAERACHRIINRKRANLKRHTIDKVGGDGRIVGLSQRRRAKTAANRSAQRKAVDNFEARIRFSD